ncbi:MAG: mandelate racemase/muconate lactonizing enzyme family protein [Oribacterium sp.]|nr:mandelate racemase/muconate lactonizing enzyme family protein [Oribacterium sp.]
MKITDVRVEHYRWPKEKPIANGKHIYTHNELNLLIIDTDEGITGYGCSWAIEFADSMGKKIIGMNPLDTERIFQVTYVPKFIGRRGTSLKTVSAIDIALWDIKAKVAGMPLYKLLGGAKEKVPFYVAGGYYAEGKGLPELQKEMEEYVSWGAKAVKMKVGGVSLKEDAARVKAVREAVGDDVKVMLDANSAYRFYEAIEFGKMVEEYHPYWFEEPVDADDYEGYRKVSEKLLIPIAGGENEVSRFGFRDLIKSQSISILNPDATCMGGVTEYMKVAGMADAFGLDMSPHGQQQVHVHLDCAVPNATIAEFYPPQYDAKVYEAFQNPVVMNSDGTVSPSQAPGAGLDINRSVLEAFRVG